MTKVILDIKLPNEKVILDIKKEDIKQPYFLKYYTNNKDYAINVVLSYFLKNKNWSITENDVNYNIDDKNSFGPSDLTWTYVAPNPTDFYADHISGCQRLENGNTLICSGPQGRFFEVDDAGDIVWEYINPVFGNTILDQGDSPPQDPFGGDFQMSNSVFRCEKIDSDFIGFENYQLFPGVPIECPPYIYPTLCAATDIDEHVDDQYVIQTIDLLGRTSHKSSVYIEIYNDGSVHKKCYLD